MVWLKYPDTPEYRQFFDSIVEARKTAIKYLEYHPNFHSLPLYRTAQSRKPMGWVGIEDKTYYYTETTKSYGRTMYGAKILYKNGKIRRS